MESAAASPTGERASAFCQGQPGSGKVRRCGNSRESQDSFPARVGVR
jgi:hypothetical protein